MEVSISICHCHCCAVTQFKLLLQEALTLALFHDVKKTLVVSSVLIYACSRIPSAPWLRHIGSLHSNSVDSEHYFAWKHILNHSLPSLPLFTVNPVLRLPVSSFRVEAHGSVARIRQPWGWSPFRNWLPVVESPWCLRRPTSIWWCSCWLLD